jgi:hypothetical protein
MFLAWRRRKLSRQSRRETASSIIENAHEMTKILMRDNLISPVQK